jgi:hypothetical protein
MHDSRLQQTPPDVILCQHARGSCGACCGVYNFADRSPAAMDRRLRRRTDLVTDAWPDADKLAEVRDLLLDEERPDVLFAGLAVCPYAGFVEGDRVGCLLHPTRHPEGEDLRDLAVYPKEVCAGHFCAPHDWLRPREVAFAQCAEGVAYGLVVTDAGLVKALLSLLDDARARAHTAEEIEAGRARFAGMWRRLIDWPHRDRDPRRFGGLYVTGDDAVERTLPSCLAGTGVSASNAERTVLDALATDSAAAGAALDELRDLVTEVAGSA